MSKEKIQGQTISVHQMLNIMRHPDGIAFSILFVRGIDNKYEGSEKYVAKALHYAKAVKANHMERGTIPLWHVAHKRPFTPFLDNIIEFNGMKVLF